MSLTNLPTVQEVAAARRGQPLPKKTRLEERQAAKPLIVIGEKEFDRKVWARDRKLSGLPYRSCRCCGRRVVKTLELCPERAEKHHLCGRLGVLRYESRCAIGVCHDCHHLLQPGKMRVLGQLWTIQAKQGPRMVLDADQALTFTRAAL
jgi:hypothetical protein